MSDELLKLIITNCRLFEDGMMPQVHLGLSLPVVAVVTPLLFTVSVFTLVGIAKLSLLNTVDITGKQHMSK